MVRMEIKKNTNKKQNKKTNKTRKQKNQKEAGGEGGASRCPAACPPRAGLAGDRGPRLLGRGTRFLGHHKLGLHVGVHFRLPDGLLEVEAQAGGLAGAAASPAAAGVAAAGLAAGRPVVGTPGVAPGLPAEPLLLEQQLQALHLAARGAVLRLPQPVPQGLAHAGLAQGGRGCGRQLVTGGSFGGEVRGRRGGCALSMAAQLGQGRGHALVVPCGTQKVIEDL